MQASVLEEDELLIYNFPPHFTGKVLTPAAINNLRKTLFAALATDLVILCMFL